MPPIAKKHIFISYRREDTNGETGRLVDALKQYFDEDQIFMDINKLEPGVDFTKAIPKYLDSSDVMLVIIGPDWSGKKQNGSTRINDPGDWVRLELEKALNRGILVIPVLVDNAKLPEAHELPEQLHPLLNLQQYEISTTRWAYDTEQLIAFLINKVNINPKKDSKWVKGSGKVSKAFQRYLLFSVAILIILSVVLWRLFGDSQQGYSKPNLTEAQEDSLRYSLDAATWSQEHDRPQQALDHYRDAQLIVGDDPKIIKAIETLQKQLGDKSK